MEDPRISRMYVEMVKRWFSSLYHTAWRRNLMRSGMVTGLILAVMLAGVSVAYHAHMLGSFHKLKAKIATDREEAPVPRPGGQEAIVLTRTRLMGDSMPEFLSVTILPGRGMNVLQLTAFVPGKGEVSLMASPTVEGAESAMTGKAEDADGQASMAMGGAFEVPWADRIWGAASQAGGHATAAWRGHTMSVPGTGTGGGVAVARGGLMLAEAADSTATSAMPDGAQAQAVFHAGDFGGHWPSKTDVSVTVLLSSRWIEFTVVARNVGDVAEPIGIGWHPRFAVAAGNRGQMRLRVPGERHAEAGDHGRGLPTGAILPVAGTPYDFTMRGGAALGKMNLDDSFVQLHQELLDNGPVAELNDPANGFGLRLTAVSRTIKAMRVAAPADGEFVAIDPQFNYDDPFGREWGKDAETGMVVLQPGKSTQWKVRLEIVSLTVGQSAMTVRQSPM